MAPSPPELDTPVGSVLFVCLGNICRSPLAEGVARHRAAGRGLDDALRIDSAGTGAWHVGEAPDPRSTDVAERNGIELRGPARKVTTQDLRSFDLVLAMDRDNLEALEGLRENADGRARIHLFRAFDPEPGDGEVPDPYFGGPDGFDQVFEMVDRTVERLLDRIEDSRNEG
jgi:protein-tyrosine phosphatase